VRAGDTLVVACPQRSLWTASLLAAQRLLETTTLTIEEVAHHTRFSSAVALRPIFRKALGLSPQRYRDAFGVGAWH
jgi:transcriptional regulator GlxA family with amidase domain